MDGTNASEQVPSQELGCFRIHKSLLNVRRPFTVASKTCYWSQAHIEISEVLYIHRKIPPLALGRKIMSWQLT